MRVAGVYDEAEIFNRSQMKACQQELYVKLGYYLIALFIFLWK